MRGRSGHNKAKPQLGRISALAGRKSRLRACKLILQRYLLTYPAWPDLSNPSMANRRAVSGEHEKPRGSHRMMPSTGVKITTIIS